jgi:transcriptional regulator with XRE-family HTH domain
VEKAPKKCQILLAKNIKFFRQQRGFSQMELAEALGISTTFLSTIEVGKKWVSPDTLEKLSAALKVETFELFLPGQTGTGDAASDEAVKYLDSIDKRLVKRAVHSVESTLERTIEKMVAKIRENYKEDGRIP